MDVKLLTGEADIQSALIAFVVFATIVKISTNNFSELAKPNYDIEKHKLKIAFVLTTIGIVVIDMGILELLGFESINPWFHNYDLALTSLFLTSGTRAIHKLTEAWSGYAGSSKEWKKSESAAKLHKAKAHEATKDAEHKATLANRAAKEHAEKSEAAAAADIAFKAKTGDASLKAEASKTAIASKAAKEAKDKADQEAKEAKDKADLATKLADESAKKLVK